MKTIIAGSRHITDMAILERAVAESGFVITEVVEGGAPGVDENARKWARDKNIPFKTFQAEWGKRGKSAGPIRNCVMADYADALIAVWDGKSRGTKHMIDTATKGGLVVFVHRV